MKQILAILIILMAAGTAQAAWDNTSAWAGNVTFDDAVNDSGNQYIKIGMLADNFNDNVIDTILWTEYIDSDATVDIANGIVNLTINNTGTHQGAGIYTKQNFSKGSEINIMAKIRVQVPSSTCGTESCGRSGIIWRSYDAPRSSFYGNAKDESIYFAPRSVPKTNCTLGTADGLDTGSLLDIATYTSGFSTGTWYTFRMNINSTGYITGYVDGVLKIEGQPDTTDYSAIDNIIKIELFHSDYQTAAGSMGFDDIRISNTSSGNVSRNYTSVIGTGELKNIRYNGTSPTPILNIDIYASTDDSTWVLIQANATPNTNYAVSGNGYKYGRWKLNTTQINSTPEIYDIGVEYGAIGGGAPSITSYAPTGSIYPEVADSQLFNVTVNQTTYCTWYINGSQVQYNATPSLTHAYMNTSLNGGGCNVTAVCNNSNGSDSQSWIFEVGADSISYIILQDTPTNQSMIKKIDVTRIGSNVTDWGIFQNHTFDGWTYYFWDARNEPYQEIMNLTASCDNESLWFNGTSLLPAGLYFIDATSTAPVITNLTNSTPQTTSVTITWDTDISSNNRVYYGTNETEINLWTNGTWSSWHNSTTSISIGLSGLSANTTYYYKPESRDVAINQSVAAENFRTAESTGIETFVNPSFISTGAAAILFVAAAGRFAISAWRNRRRKRRN